MNLNSDFKKGFWIGLGVGAALVVIGAATGMLRRAV